MSSVTFITVKLKSIIICTVLLISMSIGIYTAKSTDTPSVSTQINVPIIMYHSILKDPSKTCTYVITPDSLESDLMYLQQQGYTSIFMKDLINYVHSGTQLPEKPIILTFDDGHLNNLEYALPLLKKYNQKAVISIVGSYTEQFTNHPDENPNYAYLSWNNVKTLINSGRIEIQNHSYNMHSLNSRQGTRKTSAETDEQYKQKLSYDVLKLQELCKQNLGYTPNVFTYPFGIISAESVQILKDLGFEATLSCNEGINIITQNPDDLYLLKRCLRSDTRSVANILSQ